MSGNRLRKRRRPRRKEKPRDLVNLSLWLTLSLFVLTTMKPFEEQLVQNAIRLSWVVLILVIIMVCSGIVLCFMGMKDPSAFSFIGLKLSSSQVGLFVIAMGIVMFFMQKRFFEMLVNPRSILSLGSRVSKVRLTINEAKEQVGSAQISRLDNQDRDIRIRAAYMRLIIEIGLTIAVLLLSFVILFTQRDSEFTKLAIALIGLAVGYWLK